MRLSAIAGLWGLAASLPVSFPVYAADPIYQLTDLGSLRPDMNARALGINSSGEVTGWSYKTRHLYHAFRFKDGVMKDLGSLGGDFSYGFAINDDGVVAGSSKALNSSGIHGFVYRHGALVDLGTLGGLNSYAWGINNNGKVVGQAERSDGATRAFVYRNGKMHGLGTLGGDHSAANGINDAGQVVGWSSNAEGSFRAFIYTNGAMTDLGANEGVSSAAVAINATGEVAGFYTGSDGLSNAFIHSAGAFHPLGQLPKRPSCIPWAINDQSQIVGSCTVNGAGKGTAFLYSDGHMLDLTKQLDPVSGAGWQLQDAGGINSAGQIVGSGKREDGVVRAVLLTPIEQTNR